MARVGEAETKNYLLGRGIAYFGDDLDSAGRPKFYRDLGNAEDVTLTVETEELEHFSNRSGLKVLDASVVLQQSVSVSLTLTELSEENVGLFLAGDVVVVVQSTAGVVGDVNLITATPAGGRWYDLYVTANPTAYPDPVGERVYSITAVVVTSADGMTTFVLGTDYEVDPVQGRIFIVHVDDGGTITDATDIDVDFTFATININEVQGLKKSTIAGALKFVSENAQNASKEREYQFHDVTLRAEGDLALLSDEFATLQLVGKAKANSTVDPDSPTVTIRQF